MKKGVEIFCCYAHQDRSLLNELKAHLMPLQRQGLIMLRSDIDITPGTDWEEEINTHLEAAQVILLLISSDFLASEYCYSKEMTRALERHAAKKACVIPIILRPVYWEGTPFSKIQALPTGAKPITGPEWHNRDDAFANVATGIREVIKRFDKPSEEILINTSPTDNVQYKTPLQKFRHHIRYPLTSLFVAIALVLSVMWITYSTTHGGPGLILHSPGSTPTTTLTRTIITSARNLYPPSTGKLAFSDPLINKDSQNHGWFVNPGCQFTQTGYRVISSDTNFTNQCDATATNFSNFAYEVHMKINAGAGGITFRSSTVLANFYYFYLDQAGNYGVIVFTSHTGGYFLSIGVAPSFHTGNKQSNTLAVVADKKVFTFYVNDKFVTNCEDARFTQGRIGVAAKSDIHPADTLFTDAKVWVF